MSTTNLFVEILVIGVGVAAWLLLIILCVFGTNWVEIDNSISLLVFLPALSIIYVLGIVMDRLADTLFDLWWSTSLRSKFFPSKTDYYHARKVVYTHEGRLSESLEYSRSRLRICRGWAVNSVMVLLTLNLFIWVRLPGDSPKLGFSLFSIISLGLLAYGSWFAWRRLSVAEYHKVKEYSEFVREEEVRQIPDSGK